MVICLSVSLLLTAFLQAEEELNQPLETGFVFIDGKYIEAPYIVERRDLAVYINGIQITKELEWPVVNKSAFDHDPGMPPNITKDMTLGEVSALLEPTRNIPFETAKLWYLFSHFSYEKAFEKAIQYYENLPNVKSLTHVPGNPWVLESYSGEKRNIVFAGPQMRRMNEVWGPEGSGAPPKSELIERVDNRVIRYRNRLIKGDLFLIFSDSGYEEYSFNQTHGFRLTRELIDIMGKPLSKEERMDELISIGLLPRADRQLSFGFVSNYSISTQLINRIETLEESLKKEYGDKILEPLEKDRDIKAMKAKESSSATYPKDNRGIAYSPDGSQIYAGCGYTYESAFFLDDELQPIINYVKDQDFDGVDVIQYKDTQGNDDDCETLTYENFRNFRFGDVVYWTSNGCSSNDLDGLIVLYLQTADQIDNWSGNNQYITPIEMRAINWYDENNNQYYHPWGALVHSEWAAQNWNSILTSSNAIVVFGCCYSYENGWAELCGGGVSFGYNSTCYSSDNEENNIEIFSRMCGIEGYGEYRKAGEAYNNLSSYPGQFRIVPTGAEITLCPATQERNPDNGDIVSSNGTGFFLVDTYCHDYESANDALTFNTFGDVTIDNVHWNDDFKVNGVEYEWNGTNDFMVYVSVHTDKFESWGGATSSYHYLDYDRVTPNNEGTMQYSFSHEDNGNFNTATSVNIPHNDEYSILFEDDVDYYAMDFNGGSTYIMYTELIGDSDLDPAFYLFNSEEEEKAFDDDSGNDYGNYWQPYIEYEVDIDQGGIYYLRVAYFNTDLKGAKSDPTGDYKLIVKEQILTPPELTSPPNLYVVDQSAITFQWDESFGATQYNIQIANDSDFNSFFLENYVVTENSAYITGFLGQGTPFYWHVKAGNQSQWGDEYSYYFMFYNGEMEPPDTPEPIRPRNNSEQPGTKITFRWECSPGAEEYDLEIAYDENFNQLFPNGDPITTWNNYISVDGFPNGDIGTEFCWRVMARNDAGTSDYSYTYHFLNIDNKITLEVPSAYPNIQDAIDAAQDGNTVLVAPGTYSENIYFRGKDIVVESSGGPNLTTINGQSNGTSVVTCTYGVNSPGRALKGFTITNGETEWGGGMLFLHTSISLENCIITSNKAEGDVIGEGFGGGIYSNDSSVELKNVAVTTNRANGCYNYLTDTYSLGDGAGIYFKGGQLECNNVYITDNFCRGTLTVGGGIYATGASTLDLNQTEIIHNGASSMGAGIYMNVYSQYSYIRNCLIKSNYCTNPDISNCGGIYLSCNNLYLEIENSNFDFNTNLGGAILCESCSCLDIMNCIFWHNYPEQIVDNSGNVYVTYSDIQDGYTGYGNIDEDPLWVDTGTNNYNLQENSPCIDAGNPCSQPDPDGTRADMGAYYYPQGFISGVITLSGGSGNIEEVAIEVDGCVVNPNSDGYYSIKIGEGKYDVAASLCAYGTVIKNNIDVIPGYTTVRNFTLNHNGYVIVDVNGSGHFTTIQEGITNAHDGETVVVVNGTYTGDGNTNLHWSNKHITVQGGNGNNPENCIIDCGNHNNTRGFLLTNSQINNSDMICGFTIKRGKLLHNNENGAGIYCRYGSSPIIQNCIIEQCGIDNYHGEKDTQYGVGIYCEGTTVIRDCIIRNNGGINIQGGVGIACKGNVLVEGCIISDNYNNMYVENYPSADFAGAGIYIMPSSNGNPTIVNNDIYNNYCTGCYNGPGDAIFVNQGNEFEVPIVISGNNIHDNPPCDCGSKGAIWIQEIGKPIEICDNLMCTTNLLD